MRNKVTFWLTGGIVNGVESDTMSWNVIVESDDVVHRITGSVNRNISEDELLVKIADVMNKTPNPDVFQEIKKEVNAVYGK